MAATSRSRRVSASGPHAGRSAWIEDALAPLARSHPHIDRHELAVTIRSATGIEALIWLRDIVGQSPEQAARTVRRSARALLDSALRQTTPEP